MSCIKVGEDTSTINIGSNLGGGTEPATENTIYACQTSGPGTVLLDKVTVDQIDGAGVITRKARGTPGALEDVSSSEQLGYMDFRAYSGGQFFQMVSIAAYVDGAFTSGEAPPSRLAFFTNELNGFSTERMRIRNDGAVFAFGPFYVNATQPLIGTSPFLTVQGTSNDWTGVVYAAPASGAGYGLRAHTTGATSLDYTLAASSGVDAGRFLFVVLGNGDVGIGTATPTAQLDVTGSVRFGSFGAGTLQTDANGNLSVSSDGRLKDILGAFTRGLEAIEAIKPILYRWKPESGLDTVNAYVGMTAQNVETSIPEAVGCDPKNFLTLNDRALIATLINSVKELSVRLRKLEAAVARDWRPCLD